LICSGNLKKIEEINYDELCNLPKRELIPAEIIEFAEAKKCVHENLENIFLIDTRDKERFDNLNKKIQIYNFPVFEIKKQIAKIWEIISESFGDRIFLRNNLKSK